MVESRDGPSQGLVEKEERSGHQRGCGARIFFFSNTKTSFLKGLSGISGGEGEAGVGAGGGGP